jgi:hypothetical protein
VCSENSYALYQSPYTAYIKSPSHVHAYISSGTLGHAMIIKDLAWDTKLGRVLGHAQGVVTRR